MTERRFKVAFFAIYSFCAISLAQTDQQALASAVVIDEIMTSARAASADGATPISAVREAALREAAETVGARRGLRDKSCAIAAEIERTKPALEKRYRFSDLMMGKGVMPPVITEARDSVALDATVMRVASRVYRLDEPARVVDIAPTWRDWLYVGLSVTECDRAPGDSMADVSTQLRPRDQVENDYFRSALTRAYVAGQRQGAEVFRYNLARLERSYVGMRRFFELHARGMVSAPVIVASTDVVRRDDPNTLIVGNTVIRVTVPSDFIEEPGQWKPLAQ